MDRTERMSKWLTRTFFALASLPFVVALIYSYFIDYGVPASYGLAFIMTSTLYVLFMGMILKEHPLHAMIERQGKERAKMLEVLRRLLTKTEEGTPLVFQKLVEVAKEEPELFEELFWHIPPAVTKDLVAHIAHQCATTWQDVRRHEASPGGHMVTSSGMELARLEHLARILSARLKNAENPILTTATERIAPG